MKRGAKTQAIRDYIAENPDANPKAIVAGLQVRGITVKLGLANNVKYSKRSKTQKRRAPIVHAAARMTTSPAMTFEQLVAVKKLADSLGGADNLRAALDALAQLQ